MMAMEESAVVATSLRNITAGITGHAAGNDAQALTVTTVQAAIHACVVPVTQTEWVPLSEALGRVLAGDILSPIDLPGHDNSAMDGWALRSADLRADTDTQLTQVGTALAGHPYAGPVGPGECVRIMTGAMLPAGTDSVVMQEIVRADGMRIVIARGEHAGRNVRHRGESLLRGAVALPAGTLLRPSGIGLAASLGIQTVMVRRRLRVAFFSTGDELRMPGEVLRPGDIYDSNRQTVGAMLQRLGCDAIDLGAIGDDPARLEAAFRQAAASADVVITTGGVSAGDHDFTRPLMEKLGEVLFWKIAIRPGRPMAFGRITADQKAACLFALPGNPVAVMVTFYQFVRSALLAMMGQTPAAPLALSLPLQHALRKKPGRTEFLRGIVESRDGLSSVRSTGSQGSAMLSSMCDANCFIVLRHEQGDVQQGDLVEVMLFEGLI